MFKPLKIIACTIIAALSAVLIFGMLGSAAQQNPALTIHLVKEGLYVIMGSGGNVGVRVTSEGVILIDDKFPRNFSEIEELVSQVSDLPVKYVLNTHHHGDHSGGNIEYIKTAEIIAHRNARDNMLRNGQDAPPRIVFTDETAVYLGGAEVRAFYMGRGHTNGDAVIYFPDLKTVHGGDLLHGISPFVDYGNGGSSEDWVGTVNNILSLDFDTVIPGHGDIMDRNDVMNFRNQWEAMRMHMAKLIASGVSKEDIAERIVTEELSWTTLPDGLFMRRTLPGFYDEIAAQQ